LFNTQQIFF